MSSENSESVLVSGGASLRRGAHLKWAATGLAVHDLGLESAEPLFEPTSALSARLERLTESPTCSRWRFPLPGTPDARGNLSGKPGPLGTGWLWLTVFRGGLGELLRARCTHPRSASRAEREWNLFCHLRAHGVGTPEPLLVGARGRGFVSGRSFLLVRAPEDAFPLPRWLRTDGIGAERERGLVALAKTLALLVRSGVELPELRAEDVWLTPSGSGECETEAVGLRKNRAPSPTRPATSAPDRSCFTSAKTARWPKRRSDATRRGSGVANSRSRRRTVPSAKPYNRRRARTVA